MTRIEIPSDATYFSHWIGLRQGAMAIDYSGTIPRLAPAQCHTPRGEPICRCCTYILDWALTPEDEPA